MIAMPSSFSGRLVVPRGVVTRAVERSTVLLNSQSGRYFTLDEIGTRAWSVLTTSPSIQAGYDALLLEFAADPDRLARDLAELIDSLSSLGLAEIERD